MSLGFICLPCKNQKHENCDGKTKSKTWSDCGKCYKEAK